MVNLPGNDTTKYGKNSLNVRGTMFANILPKYIKLSRTLEVFDNLKEQLILCSCDAYRF